MLLRLFFDTHIYFIDKIRVLIRADLSHHLTLCVIPSLYSVILLSHVHTFSTISTQRLSDEAKSCINDVIESFDTDYFEEEFQCAEIAVGNAGIAYSELLEELALTNEGVQLLNEVRKVVAPALEGLREELRMIGKAKSKEV